MKNIFNNETFLFDYNILLSKALLELDYSQGALASPTLNKQETISFLFKNINDGVKKKKILIILKNRIIFIFLFIYYFIYLLLVSILFRVKINEKISIYIRTWLVPKSIDGGVVFDDYFRELINDLSVNNNVVVAFQPQGLTNLLFLFKKFNKNNKFIIPIGLLSFIDILKLFKNYFFSARVKLRKEYIFNNLDVVDYINQSLDDDFFKFRSFFAYLEASITKKIIILNPNKFIYIFENQAWEKSSLQYLSKTSIETIGYQSSGLSFRFLNFFPTFLDIKHTYFPDKLYTVGNYYTDLLKKKGVYPDIIKTFAALRFNYLFKNNVLQLNNYNKNILKRVVYAFSVHNYQYNIIIDHLVSAFSDCEIEIVLKFHPLYLNHKYHKKLPPNFKLFNLKSDFKLNEFCDFVLFNDNSFGIEALVQGVRSYQFDFGEIYPENRLVDFDLYDCTINLADCILFKDKILNNKLDKSINVDKLTKYILNNYQPYNPKLNNYYFKH